ncbi:MAG: TIGR03619 family F420-dependent LLM class oxidoreductase [Gammaproteobacteria bacterium]|nr:TIGR03619 family F420-dependent LLM class oxidoreductase [Gammaproteobacteria bacterium]
MAAEVALLAEDLGFESLWTGEHVVLPDPQAPPSPAPPLTPMLHPSTSLAWVAAVTEEIRIGTGITLIAQRNPLVLAKEMASLDVLSGGRLIMGIGAGYLEAEFDALGIPFAGRGRRADEYIRVLRELWSSEAPEFDGEFTRSAGRPVTGPVRRGASACRSTPAACRRPAIGARSPRLPGLVRLAVDVEIHGEECAGCDRGAGGRSWTVRTGWGGLRNAQVTPRRTPTLEDVEAYEDLGVDRLVLLLPQTEPAAVTDFLESIADELFDDDEDDDDD